VERWRAQPVIVYPIKNLGPPTCPPPAGGSYLVYCQLGHVAQNSTSSAIPAVVRSPDRSCRRAASARPTTSDGGPAAVLIDVFRAILVVPSQPHDSFNCCRTVSSGSCLVHFWHTCGPCEANASESRVPGLFNINRAVKGVYSVDPTRPQCHRGLDTPDLGSGAQKACGFKSRPRHSEGPRAGRVMFGRFIWPAHSPGSSCRSRSPGRVPWSRKGERPLGVPV
jgi:hypothetical protein